ncbi:MAG: universal stress protein [Magnetococcales bacterium]|nr:universal stress protein [Magnetococcales bacterium]
MSIAAVKNILVPIDFSPDSLAATMDGLAMANLLGAEVTLLHVIHDPLDAPGFYMEKKKKKKQKKKLQLIDDAAQEKLEEFIKEKGVQKQAKNMGVKLHIRCRRGIPVSQIIRHTEKKDFGMIVMGSSGRTGISSILLGSVAERVVEQSQVPVLVVKKQKSKKQ